MINLQRIPARIKEMAKRIGAKTWIAACAVLLLGSVVVINYVLTGGDSGGSPAGLAVDLSEDVSAEIGENTAAVSSAGDYFSAISLQRRQARDEAMEVLLSVSENVNAASEVRQAAVDDMNAMARDVEKEANIETLVLAKGFEQCVAVISENNCSVIVECDGLMPGEIAQISEIVYEQAGIVPENLKIIEKSVQ